MKNLTRNLALIAATAFLLTGCTQTADTPAQSSEPAPTVTATPTPTVKDFTLRADPPKSESEARDASEDLVRRSNEMINEIVHDADAFDTARLSEVFTENALADATKSLNGLKSQHAKATGGTEIVSQETIVAGVIINGVEKPYQTAQIKACLKTHLDFGALQTREPREMRQMYSYTTIYLESEGRWLIDVKTNTTKDC